jgi:hypothetical protein
VTDTELRLLAVFKAPAVRLEDVCEHYFGIAIKTANDYATLNKLPIPAFRLVNSQKAPWMVKLSDLAAHIDNAQRLATELWEKSQV